MKRMKRDKTERAYKLGYIQGSRGHAKTLCPFQESDKRGEWMGGWRTGHADYVAGYRTPTEM